MTRPSSSSARTGPTGTALYPVVRGGPPSADPPDYTGELGDVETARRALQARLDRATSARSAPAR